MVGTALHWHPVPLSLPLLASSWAGKIETSAGHVGYFTYISLDCHKGQHNANQRYIIALELIIVLLRVN